MPRKKLSEFRSKQLVHQALDLPYSGWEIALNNNTAIDEQLSSVKSKNNFVVKVDQGIKGRFKKGLVLLDIPKTKLEQALLNLQHKGYDSFIIEPMVKSSSKNERYLCVRHDRQGLVLSHSTSGGVDVESNTASIKHTTIDAKTDWQKLADQTKLSADQLRKLTTLYDSHFFTLLEINPYIVTGGKLHILDTAVEVDDAGEFFTEAWETADQRNVGGRTPQEQAVLDLAKKSPASFKLDVINPNGAVFVLLSGGGASITVADEIYAQGSGDLLANYGEYSGNPNTEETYLYTQAVFGLLLASKAPRKTLIIGGGVANFTDIANTFGGIIQAINEVAGSLKKQRVKVFVRRGGPRQDIGLAKIKTALQTHGLLGAVHDPSTPLSTLATEALQELKR